MRVDDGQAAAAVLAAPSPVLQHPPCPAFPALPLNYSILLERTLLRRSGGDAPLLLQMYHTCASCPSFPRPPLQEQVAAFEACLHTRPHVFRLVGGGSAAPAPGEGELQQKGRCWRPGTHNCSATLDSATS